VAIQERAGGTSMYPIFGKMAFTRRSIQEVKIANLPE